jgi:hypothetical protein
MPVYRQEKPCCARPKCGRRQPAAPFSAAEPPFWPRFRSGAPPPAFRGQIIQDGNGSPSNPCPCVGTCGAPAKMITHL